MGRSTALTSMAVALTLAVCGRGDEAPTKSGTAVAPAPTTAAGEAEPSRSEYLGTASCTPCHETQHQTWIGSHHDLAMQEPSDASVLGAFDDSKLTQGTETFIFSRANGRYTVEVRGSEGKSETFPVRYTFGADPLQQYLVDVGDGRLQALLVAWDARPKEGGGQRWFHLQADEAAPPGDALHWKAPVYNWNSSCAACHSTGVNKGYDRKADRFDTTFADIDVGCEACHGPGSKHVETAKTGAPAPVPFALTKPEARRWFRAEGERIAKLQGATGEDPELERCAPCHSRRAELKGAEGSFHDAYRLALLDEGLYFADGQIDDEVFVYGSFLQSKMHDKGVVCSDCHDPHSGQLRAQGNAMCTSCHGQEVFDTTQHHQHPAGSEGAQCVACHMPQRTYMQLDDRADHRFGVPDPEVSAATGSPDPCLACHQDWTPQRAAEAIAAGREGKPKEGFGRALLAARRGDPAASSLLLRVLRDDEQPPIVRATALRELGRFPSPALADQAQRAAADPDPLIRRVAAQLAATFPSPLREQMAIPLLSDSSCSVRLEATAALLTTGAPPPPPAAKAFEQARAEYAAVQEAGADRAQGRVNLAELARIEGKLDEAQNLLEAALRAEPALVAAHVNLADLHRSAGRESEADKTLRAALDVVVDPAPIRHALGLSLIRAKRVDEAVRELQAAHRARPDVARYGFVYAVALFDSGRQHEALTALQRVHERHPGDLRVLATLAEYAGRLGKTAEAQRYRETLRQRTATAG